MDRNYDWKSALANYERTHGPGSLASRFGAALNGIGSTIASAAKSATSGVSAWWTGSEPPGQSFGGAGTGRTLGVSPKEEERQKAGSAAYWQRSLGK
ncbi:hypothetical protein Q5752_003542 [Cryptotrichosporon argae]